MKEWILNVIKKLNDRGRGVWIGLVSIITVICGNCYTMHSSFGMGPKDYFSSLVKVLFWFILFSLLVEGYSILTEKLRSKDTWNRKDSFLAKILSSNFKMTGIFFGIFLLYLLCFYPATASWDTANQINDYFDGVAPILFGFVEGQPMVLARLNDHHPVFTALIYGGFTALGQALGNQNLGMFLCVALQAVMSAFFFSKMIQAMEVLGVPAVIRKICFLFIALCPFVGLHVICCMKDSLYACFFVAYFTEYLLLLIKKSSEKRHWIYLVILSFILALTKKTGVYLVFLCNLCLLLEKKLRKHYGTVLFSALCPAVLVLILMPKILFPMLQIYPGGKQEILGTLFQQTARIVRDNPEALSEKEIEIVDKVISYDVLKNEYEPECTDKVKASYKLECTLEERKDYLRVWLKGGLQRPWRYIEATLTVCGGFFSPNKVIDIFDGLPLAGDAFAGYHNPDGLAYFRKGITVVYYGLANLPIVKYLFSIAVYIWILPAVVVISVVTNKRNTWKDIRLFLIAMSPIFISILILIVCPICYARYTISQLYVVPFILAMGFVRFK